ncbi:MAG: hypothetical protein IPO65_20905 [Saprospiraceae bacterium]|nr:hypothetical protein [Saprospiraceae bacterium]
MDSLLSGYPWSAPIPEIRRSIVGIYFIYQEPAAILSVLFWAWPHMSPQMQARSKDIVSQLMQDEVQAPWANHPVDRSYGRQSELFPVNTDWNIDSPFGNFKHPFNGFIIFGILPTGAMIVYWSHNIMKISKEFFNSRAHESRWDSGNL